MAERGDWVTPRLYGKPWFEKPPLYYWMAGASFKLFGVSEVAARLPSAICALLATLALAWLAWRAYGAETARWLLLLLPTSIGMIGFSHAAATDMPFSAMLTIAMVGAAVVLGFTQNENTPILPRTPWFALLLFGFFLGLAALAKGPAAIVLSVGGVFFWALFTKRWRDAFRLLHPVAIASFCAAALPWYILCARRNPDFLRVFIIEHNFKRYLTPEFQHIQPSWYYMPVLLVALLPWSLPFAGMIVRKWFGPRDKEEQDQLQILFWSGAIFCFLFFSISKSKLPGYILPAILLLGFILSREFFLFASSRRKLFRWFLYGSFALLFSAALLIGSVLKQPTLVKQTYADALSSAIATICLPLVLVAFSVKEKSGPDESKRTQIICSLFYCAVLVLASFALRLFDPAVSSRYLTERITGTPAIARNQIRVYHLQRSQWYQLNFYFHDELKEFDPTDKNTKGIITSFAGASELVRSGVRLGTHISGNGLSNEANLYEILPSTSAEMTAGGGQVR